MSNLAVGATIDPGHASDDPSRRDFIHIAAIAAAAGGAASVAWPFIDQMNPAADTLALASVEFDLTKVMEGMQVTIKWRGKPLFIRNRSAAEIAASPEIRALVEQMVEKVNAPRARHEQVKRFAILPRDFSQEAGEVTPTLKLRRRHCEQLYASVIDELYAAGRDDAATAS